MSDSSSEVYRNNKLELQRWPYTVYTIEETLDQDMISGRGKQLLFQGLNSKDVVAFAGSGLSMAYGRLSWDDWLDKQLGRIHASTDTMLSAIRATFNHIRESERQLPALEDANQLTRDDTRVLRGFFKVKENQFAYYDKELRELFDTFRQLREAQKYNRNAPVLLQVAQQLHDKVREVENLYVDPAIWQKSDSGEMGDPSEVYKVIIRASKRGFYVGQRYPAPEILLNKLSESTTDSAERFEEALTKYLVHAIRPEAHYKFSDVVKILMIDECAHAEDIVIEGTNYSVASGRVEWSLMDKDEKEVRKASNLAIRFHRSSSKKNNLSRNISGIRDMPDRYKVLGYFKSSSINYLKNRLLEDGAFTFGSSDSDADEIWRQIIALVGRGVTENGNTRRFVSPNHRFVFSMLTSLLEDPYEQLVGWVTDDEENEIEDAIRGPVRSGDFKGRQSLFDNNLDPLETLVARLNVKRFMTTNYDLEVERYFIDKGYRLREDTFDQLHEPDRQQRVDGLGGTIRDTAFRRESAAEMIGFAVDSGRNIANVYHLHGSATQDGHIVVTERDYMDLYLREDEHHEVVNESIRIAFSSNTLFFVGLGMSEDDVLRPLRQFMSDRSRAEGRRAIALLAADGSKTARAAQSSSLYVRYGVHAVYYGDAIVEVDGREKSIPWLHYLLTLVDELLSINQELHEALVTHARTNRQERRKEDRRKPENQDPWGGELDRRLSQRRLGKDGKNIWNAIIKQSPNEPAHALHLKAKGKLDRISRRLFNAADTDRPDNVLSLLFKNWDGKRPHRLGQLEFRSCYLPTIQTWEEDFQPNAASEIGLEVQEYLEFELKLVAHFLRLTVHNNVDTLRDLKKDWTPRLATIRDLNARIIGLKKVSDSIRTGMFCAGLDALNKEWNNWWRRWELSPPHRVPEMHTVSRDYSNFIESELRFGVPTRHIRHYVRDKFLSLTPTSEEDPGTGVGSFDSFLQTVSQSAVCQEAFIDDLGAGSKVPPYEPTKFERNLYLVLAESGGGKGTFLSAFNREIGTELYIRARYAEKKLESIVYLSADFINLSFSSEIASVFDMIVNSLVRANAFLMALPNGVTDEELGELLEAFETGALDDDFVKSMNKVTDELSGLSRTRMLRELLGAFAESSKRSRFRFRYLLVIGGIEQLQDASNNPKNREIDDVLRVFAGQDSATYPIDIVLTCDESRVGNMFLEGSEFEKDLLSKLSKLDLPLGDSMTSPESRFVSFTLPNATSEGLQLIKRREESSKIELLSYDFDTLKTDKTTPICYVHFSKKTDPLRLLKNNYKQLAFCLQDEENGVGSNNSRPLAADVEALGRVLGHHRFCMTLVLCAAEKLALSSENEVQSFIRRVIDQVSLSSKIRKEEVVISMALEVYSNFNQIGEAEEDVNLHLLLIRHIAVIGAPIDADVLVRAPEIREYFDRIEEYQEQSRNRQTTKALNALVKRGLVFRVAPHPKLVKLSEEGKPKGGKEDPDEKSKHDVKYNDERDPAKHYRYALHRLVQQHIIQKMGGGYQTLSELNSFAPSLFVSMPSNLPRLSGESYLFLQRLVAHLSQYPDVRKGGRLSENWHYSNAPTTTRMQALRSALSTIRTIFSVAVVSRFENYLELEQEPSTARGHFQNYSIQVRWILRKAFELLDQDEKQVDQYEPDKDNWPHINALYRDEIVWLYNECGVISLVQGNLRSAASLFREAIKFNSPIEGGGEGGPQHNRLALNLAVAQIYKGNLADAEIALKNICLSEDLPGKQKGPVWFLAYGYLGQINYLTGQLAEARSKLQDAISIMRVYKDSRACAIFSLHLAKLESEQGDFEKAESILKEAIGYAGSGGHEDVRRRLILALTHNEIDQANARKQLGNSRFNASLDSIEDYALVMEMPVLVCEVNRLKAKFLFNNGETTQSGRLLSQAISMARRNDMGLQLIICLTDYGQVTLKRGLASQAKSILLEALELAKRANYQLEIERIEDTLNSVEGSVTI